jgi:hypothetical protein
MTVNHIDIRPRAGKRPSVTVSDAAGRILRQYRFPRGTDVYAAADKIGRHLIEKGYECTGSSTDDVPITLEDLSDEDCLRKACS